MLRHSSLLIALGSAVALISAIGCGSSTEATVQGVVTLDGNAVPKCMISFVPLQPGPQVYAVSDNSGNYEVYTGREAGLKAGEYTVAVVARKRSALQKTELGGPAPSGEAVTPRWYASPDTSGLTFTVKPGSNDINLELNSSPPAGWRDPDAKGRR